MIKYLLNKKVYLLVNFIIIATGYFLISKGLNIAKGDNPNISNIYVSIGTSLIATGIVVFLDLWKNFSISKMLEKIKNIINDGGIQYVYPKRDIDRYDLLMKNISNSLDITGYSLGGFFDSFSEVLKEKMLKSKLQIRVIFVDPSSLAAEMRADTEGKSIEIFRQRINTFKNYFQDIEGIEIRFLNAPLSIMIFRIDDVMFVGPHFYQKQSKSTFTMELKKDKWIFNEYQKEFERMWENSKPFGL